MSPVTEPFGHNDTRFSKLTVVKSTESTNAELLEAAHAGQSGPVVLVADHQTKGRGRNNRHWVDRPGQSLLVSYAIDIDPTIGWLLPFVAALAAKETVDRCAGDEWGEVGPRVGLKWPNDVLDSNDGAKLAGILVESIAIGTRFRAVVGMGMNLVSDPSNPGFGALDRYWHQPLRRDQVLDSYLVASERWLSTLETTPEQILVSYRSDCLTLGHRVRFSQLGQETAITIEGMATEVDDQGRLVVVDGSGLDHRLVAGDVHHID